MEGNKGAESGNNLKKLRGDRDARFLIKLARSVNRLDWESLTSEMSAYELQVHAVAAEIDPYGDDLTKWVATMSAMMVAMSNSAKTWTQDNMQDFAEVGMRLMNRGNDAEEPDPTPDQAAKQGKAAFAKIGVR